MKNNSVPFAIAGALLIVVFLAAVNLMTSPGFLWSAFPSLAILWWPLAMAFKGRRKPFGFSLAGAALVIATVLTINLMTSPGFLWSLFPSLAILWWPLAVGFKGRHKPFEFSLAGAALVIATVLTINLMTSPGFLWSLFPIFGVLWWPVAVGMAGRQSGLGLSIAGSLLVIALAVTVNLITSPGFLWCVFPIFAVLWWPLAMFFRWLRNRNTPEAEGRTLSEVEVKP